MHADVPIGAASTELVVDVLSGMFCARASLVRVSRALGTATQRGHR
jgi:hypothetical protein